MTTVLPPIIPSNDTNPDFNINQSISSYHHKNLNPVPNVPNNLEENFIQSGTPYSNETSISNVSLHHPESIYSPSPSSPSSPSPPQLIPQPIVPLIQTGDVTTSPQINQLPTLPSSHPLQFSNHIYNQFIGSKSFINLNDIESQEDNDDSSSRKYKCDVIGCKRSFKRSGHLKRHKIVHIPQKERRRFYCASDGCDKHYSTKYDLVAHEKQVHQGVKLYKCIYKGCSRRFVKKDSLEKHLANFDHISMTTHQNINITMNNNNITQETSNEQSFNNVYDAFYHY